MLAVNAVLLLVISISDYKLSVYHVYAVVCFCLSDSIVFSMSHATFELN